MRRHRIAPPTHTKVAIKSAARHATAPTKSTAQLPLEPSIKTQKPKPRPVGVRRPLRVHEERQRLRAALARKRRKAASGLNLRRVLSDAGRTFTGADIHPIAVNAWLSSNEPFHADMLRDVLSQYTAELDALVERFTSTSLSNTSLLANPLIDVPKGFGMQLVCYSQDYGALITEAKRREGAFKHMGLKSRAGDGTGRKYGFDPTEVLKRHAISFPPDYKLHHSTLTHDVHPLLRPENFHGCPASVYEQLVPGLRLATTLLLHRSTAHFWHTVAFGARTLDERLSLTHGHRCFRLAQPLAYTTSDAARFSAFLATLVPKLHIHFALWPLPNRPGLYAGMAIVPDYKRGRQHAPHSQSASDSRRCRICLHTDFYTTAQRLARLRSPDPSLVLRFNLFVAVTMCHELAHFVEMNGAHEGAGADAMREAYWGPDSVVAEMGSAFEEAVFGGKVHPIAARVDCAWGCTVYDNPNSVAAGRGGEERLVDDGDGEALAEGRTAAKRRRRASGAAGLGLLCDLTRFHTVPMDYIARLQQRETWDAGKFDEDDLDAGKALLIPRDGAMAVSVPVFDMVVWEDEARDAVSDEMEGQAATTPWVRRCDGSIVKTGAGEEEEEEEGEEGGGVGGTCR